MDQSYKILKYEGQKGLLQSLQEARESHTAWDIHWAPVRTSLPPGPTGFQTSSFLSESFFKMWNLALALWFPQIWQLLSLTAITVFVLLVSSNYFYFTIPSGLICTRLCQNISLFLKKRDHEIALNQDVRCPCSVASSLNYQPFPPSDPPAKCDVFFSPLWLFSFQE